VIEPKVHKARLGASKRYIPKAAKVVYDNLTAKAITADERAGRKKIFPQSRPRPVHRTTTARLPAAATKKPATLAIAAPWMPSPGAPVK
jgi:hypothetical protein